MGRLSTTLRSQPPGFEGASCISGDPVKKGVANALGQALDDGPC